VLDRHDPAVRGGEALGLQCLGLALGRSLAGGGFGAGALFLLTLRQ
jgi:hypothetical protein